MKKAKKIVKLVKKKMSRKAKSRPHVTLRSIIEAAVAPVKQQKKLVPIVMVPRIPPWDNKPGPYCEVVIKGDVLPRTSVVPVGEKNEEGIYVDTGKVKTLIFRRPFPTVWVQVIQGDDRNGFGIVQTDNHRAPQYQKGLQVRFAGGTETTLAKAMELISA